eukprot:8099086-Pyramimonas_sp.AAC.1
MCKEAGGRRNRGYMRGQAETRLKKHDCRMLRKSCGFEMGRWGCAERKEFGELSGIGPPMMLGQEGVSTRQVAENHCLRVEPYIQTFTRAPLYQAGLLNLSGRIVSGQLRSFLYCKIELMPHSIKPLPAATDMDIASNARLAPEHRGPLA